MIIIVQGPSASGKTTISKIISEKFSIPHISRDNIQEWLSVVDEKNDNHIQKFCSDAGYELTFKLTEELAIGEGSFTIEGCFNPESAPDRMKQALRDSNHSIVEIFLNADTEIWVQRYLDRAGSIDRHQAHGNESVRGEELADHLKEVIYRPMNIGVKVIEVDNSKSFDNLIITIHEELEKAFQN